MALATTCPHCKTSFKVVADQLKLRRGLVRCGKCQDVFSGVDYLRYIDDPKPRAAAPSATPSVSPIATPTNGPESTANLEDLKTAFFLPETIFNASMQIDPMTIQAPIPAYIPSPMAAPSGAAKPNEADSPDKHSTGYEESLNIRANPFAIGSGVARIISNEGDLRAIFHDVPTASEQSQKAVDPLLEAPEPDLHRDEPTSAFSAVEAAALKLSRIPQGLEIEHQYSASSASAKPDYLALAEDDRQIASPDEISAIDYRTKPAPRAKVWFALCALLIVLALAQGMILARNELAIQYPDLRQLLTKMSDPFGLKVELPRRFDALTIESFELQASDLVSGEAQTYIAQALLRNQAGHAVQWPAIELSLTDPSGQLLARKVLMAADYLSATDQKDQGFAARSEKNIRVRLSLNQLTPNGYSAVLFYP
jgi:predicted Zn finger-like uncharacterized protein